jgi:hypothetical protein
VREFIALLTALSTLFLVACPPAGDDDDDSAVVDDDDFVATQEVTFADAQLDADGACDWASYWPALERTNPVFAVSVEAPEPPYEIRSISAMVLDYNDNGFAGQDCDGAVELRLFAFVHDGEDLTDWTATGADWPELPSVASGKVIGDGDGDGDPATDLLTLTFDPPVRVDEPGLLWIAYETVTEEGSLISCPLGCAPPADSSNLSPAWSYEPEGNAWGSAPGWHEFPDERADLRVTIGY